jgi:hypothetical protein
MAIIVEEKKNGIDLVKLVAWIIVAIVVIVAAYYIFFAAPELVNVALPSGLQVITPISQVSLHPSDVLNNPTFETLKPPSFPLPSPQGPAPVGRTDPFVSF